MHTFIKKTLVSLTVLILLNSCGGRDFFSKKSTNQPVNAEDRVKKNIEEGRGLKIGSSLSMGNPDGGSFLFASSNALWRATLEKLDFIPLANVDYAGGVIITDWYGDTNSNEEIKVAVRFLTNEIRSDAIDVIIYKKKCIKNKITMQSVLFIYHRFKVLRVEDYLIKDSIGFLCSYFFLAISL